MNEKNYFVHNLKTLSEQYSQKQLAQDTQVSPASINNYLNKDSASEAKSIEYIAEYNALQEWRSMAKEVAARAVAYAKERQWIE